MDGRNTGPARATRPASAWLIEVKNRREANAQSRAARAELVAGMAHEIMQRLERQRTIDELKVLLAALVAQGGS